MESREKKQLEACSEILLLLSALCINNANFCSLAFATLLYPSTDSNKSVIADAQGKKLLERMMDRSGVTLHSGDQLKAVLEKHLSVIGSGEYHVESPDDCKDTEVRSENTGEAVRGDVDGLPAVRPRGQVNGEKPEADLPGDRKVRGRAPGPKKRPGGGR